MSSRYKILDGSDSGHCCFEYTVIDTSKPQSWDKDRYELVCETFTKEDAELICNCLNYHEECK